MAAKVVLIFLLAGVFGIVRGQREQAIEVMSSLRELQPRYREIQDFVINRLTEARLNSSQVIYNFHSEIIDSKDQYVRRAIAEEQDVLTILDRQLESIDRTCLGFVRSSVDMNVNLIGVSYTNCITRVDDSLGGIVAQFYQTIHQDETQFNGAGLFNVFQGENIFHAPGSIMEKLKKRIEELRENPSYIASELFDLITDFETDLHKVKEVYDGCLGSGMQLLGATLDIARTQIVQVCQGQLEPVENATPEV